MGRQEESNDNTDIEEGLPIQSPPLSQSAEIAEPPPKHAPTQAEFPKDGVKLSWIVDRFIPVVCGGRDAIKEMSTDEVMRAYTMPPTQGDKCSYCHKMRLEEDPAYGNKPNVFVSHVFTYKFLDVVDALTNKFTSFKNKKGEEVVVWWDLFSINQHIDGDWSIDWLRTTFKSAINDIGCVAMVMKPWNKPQTYDRGWCVFEAYCAIDTGAAFEIALDKTEQAKFVRDFHGHGKSIIDQMLAEVRAEDSKCRVASDRDQLFEAIQSSGMTFGRLNSMLFQSYSGWVVKTLAVMLKERRSTLGEDHPVTLKAQDALANVHNSQKNYDLAEFLAVSCYGKRKRIHGENSRETLTSMKTLAHTYHGQGKWEMAETLFKICLEKRQAILGDDHPDTLTAMSDLARFYYEWIVKLREGTNRKHFIDWCRRKSGQYKEIRIQANIAEPLATTSFRIRKAKFGDDHPDTLTSMHVLALFLAWQKKYHEAKVFYLACLEKRRTVLGDNHPETLMTMSDLADFYRLKGKHRKARSLYKEYAAKTKAVLGDDHEEVLATMQDLKENDAASAKQYQRCLIVASIVAFSILVLLVMIVRCARKDDCEIGSLFVPAKIRAPLVDTLKVIGVGFGEVWNTIFGI